MPINETLKKLRTDRKLTQVDLAEKLNCNRQKIADWERGKSTPSADDLILISKLFGVSTDYILGLSEAATTDRDLRFVCDYTGLNEEAVDNLSAISSDEDISDCLNMVLESKDFQRLLLDIYIYCKAKYNSDNAVKLHGNSVFKESKQRQALMAEEEDYLIEQIDGYGLSPDYNNIVRLKRKFKENGRYQQFLIQERLSEIVRRIYKAKKGEWDNGNY